MVHFLSIWTWLRPRNKFRDLQWNLLESKSTTKLVISRLFWGKNIQWKKGTTLRLIPLGNYPIRYSKPNNPALRYHTASISLLPRIFTSFKAPYNNPSLLNAMIGHFHCLHPCYLWNYPCDLMIINYRTNPIWSWNSCYSHFTRALFLEIFISRWWFKPQGDIKRHKKIIR